MTNFERIEAAEAKRLIDEKGYVLIDVRSVPEFNDEHAAGAYNIPFLNKTEQGMVSNPDFSEVVQALVADKSQGVVTSCQMGGRSVRAAQELASLGYTSVADLRGGFAGEKDGATGEVIVEGWKGSGLSTATGFDHERGYEAVKSRLQSSDEEPHEAQTAPPAEPVIPTGERWAHPERTVVCAKLKQELPAMRRKPMGGPMGMRLKKEVSAPAWEMWVEHSKMIINEYRLNPADPKAQEMLIKQCEDFFYGEGGVKPPEYVAAESGPQTE